MKSHLLIIILLTRLISVNAQTSQLTKDFAPVGSHWYYTNIPSFFTSDIDYMEIKSIEDTVIQGKNCRHLQKTYNGSPEKDEFVYNRGDTVFRLSANDTFYVLYNFSAQVGDTWRSRSSLYTDGPPEVEMTITVDSVSNEIINGYLLKVLFVSSDNSAVSFGGNWSSIGKARIIERLGGSWYMFPFNYGFLDDNIRIGLRCYSDDSLGFYNAGISQSCDEVITSINNLNLPINSHIYPNPFSNKLTFAFSDNEQTTITLFNFLGQPVLEKTFIKSMTFDTEYLSNGIYFYEFKNSKKILKTGKVIKQ